MTIRWKTLVTKLTVWLALEITLSMLGLDDIADYSEFLNETSIVKIAHSYKLS